MDALFAKIAADTIKFDPEDVDKWRLAYEPFYKDAPSDIVVERDVNYGEAERNRLDVYYSSSDTTPDKPVVIFVHGGGFYSGDKAWSDKCWANVGYYFAQRGMVSVLVNHRLVPHVTYPGGADDIQKVREWVHASISSQRYGAGSPDRVVLMGHSSGGAHIAMNLYAAGDASRPARDPLSPPVAGVVLLSAPFWFDRNKPIRRKVIGHYFGSDEEETWGPKCALGLFERLPEDSPCLDAIKLPTYVGSVRWDAIETADANVAFLNAYRKRSKPAGTMPVFNVLDRHNHLTNILSIGTEDDSQGRAVLEFIHSCLEKK